MIQKESDFEFSSPLESIEYPKPRKENYKRLKDKFLQVRHEAGLKYLVFDQRIFKVIARIYVCQ